MKTTLDVGKKYRLEKWESRQYVEVIALHKDRCWVEMFRRNSNSYNDVLSLDHDWLPYIEPSKPVEWKTFLIETLSQKTDVPYRFLSQYYSTEDARKHHKKAISITEIKLNFEIV